MRKSLTVVFVAAALLLSVVGSASAFEVCFSLGSFGNVFKFEVTQVGNFFQLTGRERVFAERATYGSAYVVGTAVRMGWDHVANDTGGASDLIWNANLSLATLSGTATAWRIRFNDLISTTIASVACTPTMISNGMPDAGAP